jgi:hypothetical protein
MKTALKEALNNLNYTEERNYFNTIKQYIETLPNQNSIERENNEENNEIEEEPPNIESNPLVNQNFIPNENMGEIPQVTFKRTADNLRQKRQVNISPDMKAMIDLIADQKKETKRLESLMTDGRTQEFVNKRNEKIKKNENKFMLLEYVDYNIDAIPDTVATKGGKVYFLMVILQKIRFLFRKRFVANHMEKYDTGRKNKNYEHIMMYPKYKKSSIINPQFGTVTSHPRHIKWDFNTTFDQAVVNQYSALQKY